MADTKIDWADKWHMSIAAKRLGVSRDEYISRRKLGLKCCSKCHQWKEINLFAKDSSRCDGKSQRCFDCNRKRKEDFIPKSRNEIYRNWYANGGNISVRVRVYSRKRKILPITFDMQESIIEYFNGKCAYCGNNHETFDHLYPVSKGGDSYIGNLVTACKHCNSSKKDSDLFEWAHKNNIFLSDKIMDVLSLAEVNGNGYFFN